MISAYKKINQNRCSFADCHEKLFLSSISTVEDWEYYVCLSVCTHWSFFFYNVNNHTIKAVRFVTPSSNSVSTDRNEITHTYAGL